MAKVLEDIGLRMQLVIATDAVILGRSDLQSVKLVVANQPSNGNTLIIYVLSIAKDGYK